MTIDQLITAHGLPPAYSVVVEQFWQPLATAIARAAASKKPLIVGINGAQGSGKSTVCAFLEVLLAARQLRAVTLSIDDLYLTKAERMAVAREVHPLFSIRGVPGTHAPGLGMAIIEHVRAGRSFEMPRFDKGTDDRSSHPERIEGPVDVLLLEGWCVACRPQADEELLDPINALERDEDPEGIWRAVVNLWLRGDYRVLFDQLDMLVMLKVEDFDSVRRNRALQEDKLRARNPKAPGLMSKAELDRFLDLYERLTLHMLEDLPRRADFVFDIGPDQLPKSLPPRLAPQGLAKA